MKSAQALLLIVVLACVLNAAGTAWHTWQRRRAEPVQAKPVEQRIRLPADGVIRLDPRSGVRNLKDWDRYNNDR